MILRYLLLAIIGYFVVTLLKKYFFGHSSQRPSARSPEKEVKNASFREDDIQDAKFKDVP